MVNSQLRLWKMMLFFLLATGIGSANAFAECQSLLEYGIYDIDAKTSDSDRTLSFREWLCQREFPSKAAAVNFLTATGIPAEVIPVRTGAQDRDTEFSDSYTAFCSDKDLNSAVNQELSRSLKKINGKMLDSFRSCVSANGLHAWVSQTKEPGRFSLNFRRNAEADPKPATVITIERFNAACHDLYLPFDMTGGSQKSFTCTRIDTATQTTLGILASEPIIEGRAYWVGKTTYTPKSHESNN